ncbi:hypothetical protein BWX40_00735 [Prevotella intermedia]|nr:hypothetical protein BWX40_00735 [Prevotella intermedia]
MHGKSGSFAVQKSRFRNAKSKLSFFGGIIFTKPKLFLCIGSTFIGILGRLEILGKTVRFDVRNAIIHTPTYLLPIIKLLVTSPL